MPHGVPAEAAFERDYPKPGFNPSWKNPQLNRTLIQDFVIFGHMDLPMVKKLLEKEPMLINAMMDWGAGDWESALGGASHMGRHDIVEFLLEKGARIDIFCAAMMGQTRSREIIPDIATEAHRLARAARLHPPLPRATRQGWWENTGLPPVGEENRTQTQSVPQEARGQGQSAQEAMTLVPQPSVSWRLGRWKRRSLLVCGLTVVLWLFVSWLAADQMTRRAELRRLRASSISSVGHPTRNPADYRWMAKSLARGSSPVELTAWLSCSSMGTARHGPRVWTRPNGWWPRITPS